jgi:hypothetical protein
VPKVLELAPTRKVTVHHGGVHVGLRGIISQLRREFSKDPVALGIVRVIPHPCEDGIVPAEYVVGTENTFGYMSAPVEGSGIIVVFPGLQVTVEAYTIESARLNPGNDHMKTWRLLGSNDGNEWTVIDEQTNTTELNGPLQRGTYHVAEPHHWKVIMLKQHERNHRGNWNICLNHFEIFGSLSS